MRSVSSFNWFLGVRKYFKTRFFCELLDIRFSIFPYIYCNFCRVWVRNHKKVYCVEFLDLPANFFATFSSSFNRFCCAFVVRSKSSELHHFTMLFLIGQVNQQIAIQTMPLAPTETRGEKQEKRKQRSYNNYLTK